MKHLIVTVLIFIAVLSATFVGTTFLFNRNAGAQSGLTEKTNSSQSVIALKIAHELDRIDKLKNKINDKLFKDPIFQSLKDFSQPLPQEEKGRENPFATIGR